MPLEECSAVRVGAGTALGCWLGEQVRQAGSESGTEGSLPCSRARLHLVDVKMTGISHPLQWACLVAILTSKSLPSKSPWRYFMQTEARRTCSCCPGSELLCSIWSVRFCGAALRRPGPGPGVPAREEVRGPAQPQPAPGRQEPEEVSLLQFHGVGLGEDTLVEGAGIIVFRCKPQI